MLTLLKTYSVMLPIANYGTLGLVKIGVVALLPLFYLSSIEIGCLGLSPSAVGISFESRTAVYRRYSPPRS